MLNNSYIFFIFFINNVPQLKFDKFSCKFMSNKRMVNRPQKTTSLQTIFKMGRQYLVFVLTF